MSKPQYQEVGEVDNAPLPLPGERLRKAREAKGLSVEDVVAQIRLERKLLEAIESDDYTRLPAPGYVRGYIRTYARFLDLDPGPLVDAFNREADEGPTLQPYASTPAHQAHSGDSLVKAVTWAIGIGLIILVVVWWRSQYLHKPAPETLAGGNAATSQTVPAPPEKAQPQGGLSYTYPIVKHPDELPPPGNATAAGPAAAAGAMPAPAASSAAKPAAAPLASPPAAATGAAPAGEEAHLGAPASVASPAGSAAESSAAPQPAAAAQQAGAESTSSASSATETAAGTTGEAGARAPAGAGEHRLVLKLNKESWIEITDSSGKRLYYNLGRAGQTIDVSGEPPLHVLIGYLPGVDISYNGKPLDVSNRARHGVARFQITADGSVE